MSSTEDPAKKVGANDLSLPDLRNLALPFRTSNMIGPVPVSRLKSDIEDGLDDLGFDVACDFGPTEPLLAEHFRNREPGSARHALEGIMVGERNLSKDTRTSRRNLTLVIPLVATGIALGFLNYTTLGASVSPLLLFLGMVLIVAGLLSLPRTNAFESEIAYVWYGYDPPGFVTVRGVKEIEKQMPTTPQMFDVHVGAGRVASADVRGKGIVGRRIHRVLEVANDLESVPRKLLDRLSSSSRLREEAE